MNNNSIPKRQRCVRCGSEENLEKYFHKNPDLITFTHKRKTTKVEVHKDTHGVRIVPVCTSCKKVFSRGNLLSGILYGLTIFFALLISMMLVFILISSTGFTYGPMFFFPMELIQTILIYSIIFGIISLIGRYYVNFFSNVQPHNVIKIKEDTIRIKPKGHKWMNIEEWTLPLSFIKNQDSEDLREFLYDD
jgi:hypothetical protein